MKRNEQSPEEAGMTAKELKDAALTEKRAYYRKWRRDNPDKVKTHNENYWRKRALLKAEAENQEQR